jgi:hypothetical protein
MCKSENIAAHWWSCGDRSNGDGKLFALIFSKYFEQLDEKLYFC